MPTRSGVRVERVKLERSGGKEGGGEGEGNGV